LLYLFIFFIGVFLIVKSPAVIKLLGEHAVVYGKPALAAAIDLYATADSSPSSDSYYIVLEDIGKEARLSTNKLESLYREYMSRKSINEYISNNHEAAELLPFMTILAVAYAEYGAKAMQINLHSEIPMQKGFASSAALSTAFAVALAQNMEISEKEVIELARIGETVFHKNEGAGKIDINASYFGGFVEYNNGNAVRLKVKANTPLDLVAIDTGPKLSTAETVGHVAHLFEKDKKGTSKILDEIERCTLNGIDALKKGNIAAFGEEMFKDHELLKALGVSTEKLDKAVMLAKKYGSPGAKLSGGGGGGIAIAINSKGVKEQLVKSGLECITLHVSNKGARHFR